MNGMSDNVSRMLDPLDLFRAMSHAIGIPAMRSIDATNKAIVKLFAIAVKARFMRGALLRIDPIAPHLRAIPSTGGSRINAKNRIIAITYTAYLTVLLDDAPSRTSTILFLDKSPLFPVATHFRA